LRKATHYISQGTVIGGRKESRSGQALPANSFGDRDGSAGESELSQFEGRSQQGSRTDIDQVAPGIDWVGTALRQYPPFPAR